MTLIRQETVERQADCEICADLVVVDVEVLVLVVEDLAESVQFVVDP